MKILENQVSGMHMNRLIYVDIEKQKPSMQASSNWFS